MTTAKRLSCPACGAPLPLKNRFVKMITCDFCGQISLVHDSGLDPTGKTAKLAEMPSLLYLDAAGKLWNQPFKVMGRLRYQYDAGLWDEWFIVFDNGKPGWLVVDEGNYSFFVKQTFTGTIPPFDSIRVGQTVQIADRQVFITERGQAHIIGGEGQLAFTLVPGEKVSYVEGTAGNALVSVEYTDDEIELSLGRPVNDADLIIESEDY